MVITIAEQTNNLNHRIQEFVACINSLLGSLFLKKMDSWASRDVVAHLIGWNRYTVEGCRQIIKRELPFYFIDPGDDFNKVNAISIQKYNSKNQQKLVNELQTSGQELRQFLLTLSDQEWEADYGVCYKGEIVTIRNTIDALINDYIVHKQQIDRWKKLQKP